MKKLLLFAIMILYAYSLKAQCDDNLPIMENFDTNTIGVCWNIEDSDGDGYDWYWREYLPIYGGYKCLVSRSYNTAEGALTPDNWVKSFPIDLSSFNTNDNLQLSWKVRGEYANLSHEYYSVYVATNNQISDFTSSPVSVSEYADEVGGTGTFVTRSIDISSLAGNTIYVAFRHHNSTNLYSINIDDVSITTEALSLEDVEVSGFRHFYNSTTDQLTISSTQVPMTGISIFNILGQNVFNKPITNTRESINLSDANKGIYIAKVSFENIEKTFKFIKH